MRSYQAFESSLPVLPQASVNDQLLSTTSLINVEFNYVFHQRISRKNFFRLTLTTRLSELAY